MIKFPVIALLMGCVVVPNEPKGIKSVGSQRGRATFIECGKEWPGGGEDGVLAAELARRRASARPSPPASLDELHYTDPDDTLNEHDIENYFTHLETRRQYSRPNMYTMYNATNFTRLPQLEDVVYKGLQLMFHSYYAAQYRVKALQLVTDPHKRHELFLMGYAFKKMEHWMNSMRQIYFRLVIQHNRELKRLDWSGKPYGFNILYYNIKSTYTDPPPNYESFLNMSGVPQPIRYPLTIPSRVFRNYTLVVHMMIDITYTGEFIIELNDKLRSAYGLPTKADKNAQDYEVQDP